MKKFIVLLIFCLTCAIVYTAGGQNATYYGKGEISGGKIVADAIDSTKIGDGKASGTDLANGTVSKAKLMANAVDSTKMATNSGAIGDIAGLSDRLNEDKMAAFADSLANSHNNAKLDTVFIGSDLSKMYRSADQTVTISDTVKFGYISDDNSAGSIPKGSFTVRHPTTGVFTARIIAGTTDEIDVLNGNGSVANVTVGLADNIKPDSAEVADYFKYKTTGFSGTLSAIDGLVNVTKEWLVPLPNNCDTTASSQDSTTVKSLLDINGLYGRKHQLYVYGNASTAADSTVWGATFNPQDTNPDSLIVWGYTTDEVNTSFSVEIYNSAGTIVYSSGNITFSAATAWEYKGVAFGTFADLNEHVLVYRVRVLNSGDAVQIGQTRFKRL
jgi:hypothetical protein